MARPRGYREEILEDLKEKGGRIAQYGRENIVQDWARALKITNIASFEAILRGLHGKGVTLEFDNFDKERITSVTIDGYVDPRTQVVKGVGLHDDNGKELILSESGAPDAEYAQLRSYAVDILGNGGSFNAAQGRTFLQQGLRELGIVASNELVGRIFTQLVDGGVLLYEDHHYSIEQAPDLDVFVEAVLARCEELVGVNQGLASMVNEALALARVAARRRTEAESRRAIAEERANGLEIELRTEREQHAALKEKHESLTTSHRDMVKQVRAVNADRAREVEAATSGSPALASALAELRNLQKGTDA